jgi:hypothetical protein
MRINARIGPTRFNVRPNASLFSKSISHRVFDFQSREIQTFERAVLCRDFNFETLFGREPLLPCDCTSCGIQVLLLSVRRICHFNQHALRQPTIQVQQQHETPVASHHHTGTQNAQVVRSDMGNLLQGTAVRVVPAANANKAINTYKAYRTIRLDNFIQF